MLQVNRSLPNLIPANSNNAPVDIWINLDGELQQLSTEELGDVLSGVNKISKAKELSLVILMEKLR